VLTFEVKSGPTGSLFGSVTPTDVVDEIWRVRKVRVDRRKVGTDPIKRIGRYSIPIEIFEGVDVEVKTLVVPEGGELPPEEELTALEAAEAEAAAAASAEHRAEHEEAEVAIAEVIAEDEPDEEHPDEEHPDEEHPVVSAEGDEPAAEAGADPSESDEEPVEA
jgi:large subunit ribosomal protein L9